jgi:hypothetical protein
MSKRRRNEGKYCDTGLLLCSSAALALIGDTGISDAVLLLEE